MHILHLLDHSIPHESAYSRRTHAIIKHQQLLGWVTSQVTSGRQGPSASDVEHVENIRFFRTTPVHPILRWIPFVFRWISIVKLIHRCRQIVNQQRPDIIHAHFPFSVGLAALALKKRYRLPMVYEVQAYFGQNFWDRRIGYAKVRTSWMRANLELYVMKRADKVIATSAALADDLAAKGVPQEKLHVVADGIDMEDFQTRGENHMQRLKAQLGIKNQQVLAFIGALYRHEGLKLLFEALPRILLKYPQLMLLVVGDGPQRNKLEATARQLDIEQKILFTGKLPYAKLSAYYQLADIMIYPRLPSELSGLATPSSILAAMALGCLVVASDVGGNKELIRNDNTGCLFTAGETDALASTVIDLLQHKERWRAQRVAARRFVEHERQWQNVVENYKEIYRHFAVMDAAATRPAER